jgi:hypothetical protein
MTYPTFSTGEVLTAASMNAVGLWRITDCTVSSVGGTVATASNGVITIGTGNTSVTVNNAFSSDYQSYRIFIENNDTNNTASHDISLGGITGSTYYVAGHYFAWTVAGGTTAYAPAPQTTFIVSANVATGTGTTIVMDIHNPNVARRKYGYVTSQAGNGSLSASIYNTSTATATSFTLSKSGNTMTGGTIRVYGYRN